MTWFAVVPTKTCLRPVDLSAQGSSSTRQTISGEGSSLGVMRICATALFPMWDVAIIPDISPRRVERVVTFSFLRAGGRGRGGRPPNWDQNRPRGGIGLLPGADGLDFRRPL